MKKILSLMLVAATLLSISCSKDESDTTDADTGAYVGTYTITGMNVDGSASGDSSIDISIKNKLATVTIKNISFHEDMPTMDIVLPDISYDESYSSTGLYGFTADTINAQSTSGEVYGGDIVSITDVIIQTDYSDAYLRFACEVDVEKIYLFEFTTYVD